MPWKAEKTMSRRTFLKTFLKYPVDNRTFKKEHLCQRFTSMVFWNNDGRLWRCWNNYFWPDRVENPVDFLENSASFERKFTGLGYLLDEQPEEQVNNCNSESVLSNVVEAPVWLCELKKFNDPKGSNYF